MLKKFEIPDNQDAFLKRKVMEIKRMVAPGDENKVTESSVVQGMLSYYMAFDRRNKGPGSTDKGLTG